MRVIVFSGTSEGKEIIGFLSHNQIETMACVATEYGKEVMEKMPFVTVHIGRLDYEDMLTFLTGYDLVIDATHPYAVLVTQNIVRASESCGIPYLRLLREDTSSQGMITVSSVKEAAQFFCEHTQGHIFVSTGSKELHEYSRIPNYKERVIARVLPIKESEENCKKLGIEQVIYEKGPFSYEQNIKAFKEGKASWLVTKSAGKAGGFDEKIEAAKALGIKVVVVARPKQQNGLSMLEVQQKILEAQQGSR